MVAAGRRIGTGREVRAGIVAFCGLLVFGTLTFEHSGGGDGSWFDALYMTVITVTTVGYNEIHELSAAGRVVAVVISLGGLGIVLYLAGTTAEAVIEGSILWRRRAARLVERMSGHFIVCGDGRVGQSICRELAGQNVPFVMVDAKAREDLPVDAVIVGDATDNETLQRAGIRQELAIIVTAILEKDGPRIFNPSPDEPIHTGEMLIAMGRPAALDRLSELACGGAGRATEGAAV